MPLFVSTRWSVSAALLTLATACASTPRFATLARPPAEPRRAPGVALDLRFAAPTATEPRALVLTPPVDAREARRTVELFLDAVVREDVTAVTRLLAPGAVQQLGTNGETRSAADYWQRRLARLDYGAVRGEALYRPEHVRVVRANGEGAPGPKLEPRELAITLPLVTTHAGKVRLFGPELTFVVSETEGGPTLSRIIEDFQVL